MSDKYSKISNEFINFRNNLKKEIENNNPKSNPNNECYCIKEKWFKEFENIIISINNKKNLSFETRNNSLKGLISKTVPEFINDINSATNILEKGGNIKIISKNLVNLLYKKEFFLNYNSAKYYAGNNKLIIEFQNHSEPEISNTLLLINPLEELSKQIIYHFSIKNQIDYKMKCYRSIIENEMENKIAFQYKIELKKISINSLRNSMGLKQNQSIDSKSPESFNLIIKFLISLYYYELSLSNNKNREFILNFNERSYLINTEWIDNIKSNYKYQGISNILIKLKKEFEYSNFSNQVDQIYEIIKKNPEIQKILTSCDIFKNKNIFPKERTNNNFSFFEKCYILPKLIFQNIRSLLSNDKHHLHSVYQFWKKNKFCFLKDNNIYIGTINNLKIFISEYVLFYNNNEKKLYEKEFNALLNSNDINVFFSERNCKNSAVFIQKINKNNNNIGNLLIVKNCPLEYKKDLNQFINKVETKKKVNTNRSSSLPRQFLVHKSSINPGNININNEIKDKTSKNEEYNKNVNIIMNSSMKGNIKINNFLFNNKEEKEENLIDIQNRENKEKKLLIKQIEDYKNIINLKEKEVNEINDLKDKLQRGLEEEKEKNKRLEEIIKNLKENYKKKEESETRSTAKNREKEEKIEELMSTNINLEEENNKLENNVQKYKKKYEDIKEKLKIYENNKVDRDIEEEKKKENNILKKQKEINEKIKYLEKAELQLKNEQNKIEKVKEKFQEIKNKNKELKELNDLLVRENKKLKEELENMKKQQNKKDKKKQALSQSLKIEEKEISNIDIFENGMNINNDEKITNQRRRSNSLPNQTKKPLELYLQPTLIGLNNIGSICYMNSTLQCLSQTGNLTNFFLTEKNENNIYRISEELSFQKELCLSKEYLKLVKKLWSKENIKSFSPNKFLDILSKMNPLFQRGDPGDAKDFIIFILEQIHKELKKPIITSNNLRITEEINQYDKFNTFNFFFEQFKKECSIISDCFFGFNETTNVCLNCKNFYNLQGKNHPICYNYNIFNCVIFPLEEVKKMKNSNFYNMNNNRVNLYECFIYNQRDELLTGENKNYCNMCRQLFDSIYTSKIYTFPSYLIIILNRGKNNIFDVQLDFTLQIDLTDFALLKQNNREIFDLYGVITHLGQSGPNAHFVASCKSPIDGKWYRYNDAIVSPINDIQRDVINFGKPYILFYKKNKI